MEKLFAKDKLKFKARILSNTYNSELFAPIFLVIVTFIIHPFFVIFGLGYLYFFLRRRYQEAVIFIISIEKDVDFYLIGYLKKDDYFEYRIKIENLKTELHKGGIGIGGICVFIYDKNDIRLTQYCLADWDSSSLVHLANLSPENKSGYW
ncbi:MAG: hypothetical protein KF732_05680 [Flavobacteriales bacterium]|nr:hypothetical protein [Flavobacteriales bacterium]